MCPTQKAGRLVTCVIGLLCCALLPDDVRTDTVSSTTQSANVSGTHDHYRCMYCRNAEHIIDCLEVVTCAPHEVCYIEKETLRAGWPVINAGCRSRHTCNLKTCFGESMHGYNSHVKKRSTLSCHHCCEGEFCNLYGCPDSEDMMVLPSTRCLACDAVKDPVYCDKLINCPYSQQCVAYGVFHAGGLRFELGCEERTYCNAFKNNSKGKRDVTHHMGEIDLASTCCDTHLCNRNWPVVDQPLPKVISGFTCHHQTRPTALSTPMGNVTTPASPTTSLSNSTSITNNATPLSSSKPSPQVSHTTQLTPSHSLTLSTLMKQTTTLDPLKTTSTYITSPGNITIPTSENCKDRANFSVCAYLNKTKQLCDAITLTSVYYCVKFCGFCTPLPTRSEPQGQTSPTPGTVNTPIATTSAPQPQDIIAPVLVGKRKSDYAIDENDRQGQQQIH